MAAGIAALMTGFAGPLAAQELGTDRSFGVAVGDRVRIVEEGEGWRVGQVTAVDASGFGLTFERGGEARYGWNTRPVQRSMGVKTRAGTGGVLGMVAGGGVLTGLAIARSPGLHGADVFVVTGILGALAGGALGVLVGSFFSSEAWAPVESGPVRPPARGVGVTEIGARPPGARVRPPARGVGPGLTIGVAVAW